MLLKRKHHIQPSKQREFPGRGSDLDFGSCHQVASSVSQPAISQLCDLGQSIETSLLPFLCICKMGMIIGLPHRVVVGSRNRQRLRKQQGHIVNSQDAWSLLTERERKAPGCPDSSLLQLQNHLGYKLAPRIVVDCWGQIVMVRATFLLLPFSSNLSLRYLTCQGAIFWGSVGPKPHQTYGGVRFR